MHVRREREYIVLYFSWVSYAKIFERFGTRFAPVKIVFSWRADGSESGKLSKYALQLRRVSIIKVAKARNNLRTFDSREPNLSLLTVH